MLLCARNSIDNSLTSDTVMGQYFGGPLGTIGQQNGLICGCSLTYSAALAQLTRF